MMIVGLLLVSVLLLAQDYQRTNLGSQIRTEVWEKSGIWHCFQSGLDTVFFVVYTVEDLIQPKVLLLENSPIGKRSFC